MKKHPSPLRRAVGLVLTLLLTLGYFSPTQQALRALPASLRLTQDEPISLLTGMLRASGEGLEVSASQDETLSQYVSVTGQKSGTSELLLSILGIPLRRVEVEVSPEKRLIPGGQALGVAMRTDGVLIVGLSDVKKGVCPARDCGLQPGDVLLRIGGHAIERVADVSEIAQQNGTSPLLIEYMRDGTTAHATLTPVQDDATGVVRLGAWVRDSTAGIGTLSFYDPDSGQYAALGHAITDGDTGSILTVREGRVLNASIVAVQKGQRSSKTPPSWATLRRTRLSASAAHSPPPCQTRSIPTACPSARARPSIRARRPSSAPSALAAYRNILSKSPTSASRTLPPPKAWCCA